MKTETISKHIATIQALAAQLTDAQDDHQRLDVITSRIHSVSWELSLEIEDVNSRIAGYIFRDFGKDRVTIKELAARLDPDNIDYKRWQLRMLLQTGIIPGIHNKKRRQWFCSRETIAEYFRLSEQQRTPSLKLAA